ncbi:MAG: hypothetical protein J5935_00180 [Lachnospiraceae bacterium]|nr:hypothetical protein [Lachnospiraceae bacterium]
MKKGCIFLSALLAACLFFQPAVVTALAAEDADTTVTVDYTDGDRKVTVGNISSSDNGLVVDSSVASDHNATVTVEGNITAGSAGLIPTRTGDGETTVSVDGTITAGSYGVYASGDGGAQTITTGDINADDDGVYIETYGGTQKIATGNISSTYDDGLGVEAGGGITTVTTGDITSSDDAVMCFLWNDSIAEVTTGNINAGYWGIDVEAEDSSNLMIKAGDIASREDGIQVWAADDAFVSVTAGNVTTQEDHGIQVWAGGDAFVSVTAGNVTTQDEHGINVETAQNAVVHVNVNDVTGAEYGINMDAGEESTMDILVTGSLTGQDAAINAYDTETFSHVDLTVWKIETTEAGDIPVLVGGSADESAEAFKEKINYIIYLEQPTKGATLSATDENGNSLAQRHDHSVAAEGDTVLLKVDLQKGFRLLSAYNGKGEKTDLVKDSAGNYYVVVPRGGGIYLSVELEKLPDPKPAPKPAPTPAPTPGKKSSGGSTEAVSAPPVNDYAVFNQQAAAAILAAAPAETVSISTTEWISIYHVVTDALKQRPDVSLKITFLYEGQFFSVIIPAGADVDALLDQNGFAGFLHLATVLGTEPVQQ